MVLVLLNCFNNRHLEKEGIVLDTANPVLPAVDSGDPTSVLLVTDRFEIDGIVVTLRGDCQPKPHTRTKRLSFRVIQSH